MRFAIEDSSGVVAERETLEEALVFIRCSKHGENYSVWDRVEKRVWRADALVAREAVKPPTTPAVAISMLLWCPECSNRHVDAGEFVAKDHHTHACQFCGH